MMNEKKSASRRTVVKGLSLAVLSPLFGPVVFAGRIGEVVDAKEKYVHRVFSANIRVALPEDDDKGLGWAARRETCKKVLQRYSPDIICLQEVLKVQMDDLRRDFPKFDAVGFEGPEMDANPVGYHGIAKNPIMYNRERYGIRNAGTYWLSETPLIGGSKSWETARARHCNWVRLVDKKSGREFRVVNTHLDHEAQGAREKQIETILAEAAQYTADFPQVFAGDFNSRSTNPVMAKIKAAGWIDTYATIHGEEDPGYTAHAFKGVSYAEELKARNVKGGRIDFIFAKSGVVSKESSIVKDQINGVYPSDHYFIYADVTI